MSPGRYFWFFIFGCLLASSAVVAFNILVDPLDVFRIVKVKNINLYKPAYPGYEHLAKPLQISQIKPQRIAIGSSRVLMGIPADHAAWTEGVGFNAGVSGATLKTAAEILEHAIHEAPVNDVLVSADLFMFNAHKMNRYLHPLATSDETERQRSIRLLKTFGMLLFSTDTTGASFYTLKKQSAKYHKVLATGEANPEYEQNKSIKEGYEQRFIQFENILVNNGWSYCSDNQLPFDNETNDASKELDRILELAGKHNLRLRLFISPLHARLLETMYAAGFSEKFEQMKRLLVSRTEQTRQKYPALDVEIWDFSGYHHFAVEPFPRQEGMPMRWYYDASHFSDALGRVMLDNMYLEKPTDKFGTKIQAANINSHLLRWREEQRVYREQHMPEYREISERVRKLLEEKRASGKACKPLESYQNDHR